MGLDYKIEFILGDWSRDGHGIIESVYILSNKPIKKLYELGVKFGKTSGIEFNSWNNMEFWPDYEKSRLKDQAFDRLKELGIIPEDKENDDWYGENAVDLIMNCLKWVDHSVEWEFVQDNGYDKFVGIGYGLCSL